MNNWSASLPKDHGNKSKDDDAPEEAKQVEPHPSEIIFRLESKEGQAQTNGGCDSHSNPDPFRTVVDSNAAKHQGQGQGEDA